MTRGDRPTGEQLVEELRRAAREHGAPLGKFIRPLVGTKPCAFLGRLERAWHPQQSTVERVRALIAGQPIPDKGPPDFRARRFDFIREDGDPRLPADSLADRIALTERARAERRPGETLAAAVERLAALQGEQA